MPLRSLPECLAQYESLRRQALEPSLQKDSLHKSAESAIIERQGLVAWVERDPESAVPVGESTTRQQKAESSHHELVMVLTQFVVGDREETENG
jgi:hypothetical protein